MKKLATLFTLLAFPLALLAANPVLMGLSDGKSYARLSEDRTLLLAGDYKTGTEDTLVTFSAMRNKPLDKVEAFLFSPDEKRVLFRYADQEYYVYNFASNRCDPLSVNGKQATPIFSPDGSMIAFIRENNIFIKRLLYDTEVQVTEDGSSTTYNGSRKREVSQAFGRADMMLFNATSEVLVYVKNDDLYLYHIHYKWNRRIVLPAEDGGYITHLSLTTKENQVAVMYVNHVQNELRVAMVDVKTMIAKQIYLCQEDRYISPENAAFIQFLPQNQFLILDDQDGYNHLYLYNANGVKQRQIAKGQFDVTKVYGYSSDSQQLYYQSTENGRMNRGIYAVSLKNGKKRPIAVEAGTNDAIFSPNFDFLELIYSNINQPHVYSVMTTAGKSLRILQKDTVNVEIQKEFFQFTDSLQGWILRKPGMQNAPVVMDVCDTRNQWQQDISYSLVEQGYIVASVAVRGEIGAGEEIRKSVYGNIFLVPAQDYIAAAKGMIKQGIAQPKNVFIMGNRMAGGVVLSALAQNHTPFAGGIVISPVTDLTNYNPVEIQRYMNKEGVLPGYRTNSAVKNAQNISGKLLIIHAMNDGVNSLENTNRLVDELVKHNIQFDMQLYPYRDESFTASLLQPHLFNRILNFLKMNTSR